MGYKKLLIIFSILVVNTFYVNSRERGPKLSISGIDTLLTSQNTTNIDTSFSIEWNEDSARWKVGSRTVKYFADDDELKAVLEQKQSKKGDWDNVSRVLYSYNSRGKKVEELKQLWDSKESKWINKKLNNLYYDSDNNLSNIYVYNWNRRSENWNKYLYLVVKYNRGRKKEIITRIYPNEIDKWTKYEKIVYHYRSESANPYQSIIWQWDQNNKEWEKNGRYYLTYSTSGNLISKTLSTWNKLRKNWSKNKKYFYSWEGDKKTLEIKQIRDIEEGKWINKSKLVQEYDDKGKLKLKKQYKWDSSTQEWYLHQRSIYSPIFQNLEKQKVDSIYTD